MHNAYSEMDVARIPIDKSVLNVYDYNRFQRAKEILLNQALFRDTILTDLRSMQMELESPLKVDSGFFNYLLNFDTSFVDTKPTNGEIDFAKILIEVNLDSLEQDSTKLLNNEIADYYFHWKALPDETHAFWVQGILFNYPMSVKSFNVLRNVSKTYRGLSEGELYTEENLSINLFSEFVNTKISVDNAKKIHNEVNSDPSIVYSSYGGLIEIKEKLEGISSQKYVAFIFDWD